MTLLSLTHNTEEMGALYYFITFNPSNKAGSFKPLKMRKHIGISNRAMTNQHFTLTLVNYLVITTCISWLLCLLLQAGDVHPNPGPSSTASDSSISSISSESISSYLNIPHHLSFVHYNVQSILTKFDLLTADLADFDILAFSETWLRPEVLTDSILLPSFFKPERKDRVTDPHGGVAIYVKNSIIYTRRHDLELPGIECIWIEVILKQKRLLFGLFYRPPNSDQIYHSAVEDSVHLAVDTGIKDIVVTGDFNYNMLNDITKRKISGICQQFSLIQCINEPTHFTETSSSLTDLVLV